jgi:hypothetical protein
MTTNYYKMTEIEKCLICNKWIGKGHDPAVCGDDCLSLLKYEMNFNKWAKSQVDKKRKQFNKKVCALLEPEAKRLKPHCK